MKTVGLLVCGAGEGDRYLAKTLDQFERLCDDVVVAGNGTDPKTERMIRERGFYFYRDDREWGRYQPTIKTDLLRRINGLRPDLVVPLDADEVFDPLFDRAALESVASSGALGYYFYIVNLWNDEAHHWRESGFWNVRMFRPEPALGLEFLKRNVHCGLAPPYAYKFGRYAPFHVKHYGLMREEDRRKKVARYEKYDPHGDKVGIGAYYAALSGTGPGTPFDEAEMRAKVAADVGKMVHQSKSFNLEQHMANPTKYYHVVITKKNGVQTPPRDISEAELEMLKRRSDVTFEVIGGPVSTGDRGMTAPPPLEADSLQCPICETVCASESELSRHKSEAHGAAETPPGDGGEALAESAPAEKPKRKLSPRPKVRLK